MDNTEKFSGRAEIYSAARPSYPDSLFDYLKSELGVNENTVFADIASGTGKFTEPLVKMGCTVYAVEPNGDMRRQAEQLLGGCNHFISVNAGAENTGLPDASVDYISAAQAFHWFDPQLFAAECKRILKPEGKVIILYNMRDEKAPLTVRLAEVCRRLCPHFKGFGGGNTNAALEDFFSGGFKELSFENDLYYSRKSFVQRMLSASYAPLEDAPDYSAFVKELESLFDEFAQNGVLLMPNHTYMYIGIV